MIFFLNDYGTCDKPNIISGRTVCHSNRRRQRTFFLLGEQGIDNRLHHGILDKDTWKWEENIGVLDMSILFKSGTLCDPPKMKRMSLRRKSFRHSYNTLNETTLGGNNTFGYVVAVALREPFPCERNGSPISCEGQRDPATAHRDSLSLCLSLFSFSIL